jgi:hypothetical protein
MTEACPNIAAILLGAATVMKRFNNDPAKFGDPDLTRSKRVWFNAH